MNSSPPANRPIDQWLPANRSNRLWISKRIAASLLSFADATHAWHFREETARASQRGSELVHPFIFAMAFRYQKLYRLFESGIRDLTRKTRLLKNDSWLIQSRVVWIIKRRYVLGRHFFSQCVYAYIGRALSDFVYLRANSKSSATLLAVYA